MDVEKLLEGRARVILIDALIEDREAPPVCESQGARNRARRAALESDQSLDMEIKNLNQVLISLDDCNSLIDQETLEAARDLAQRKAVLLTEVAATRHAIINSGLSMEEFAELKDENAYIQGEIDKVQQAIRKEQALTDLLK